MTNRDRVKAVLHYQNYDRLPLVHFGFWRETVRKWVDEGHLTSDELSWGDGNPADVSITRKLGFDCNWQMTFHTGGGLRPGFEQKVIRELPDGSRHILNHEGVVILQAPGAGSIPAEIEHTLKDRASWEEHYKHRFQWDPRRVEESVVRMGDKQVKFCEGGKEFLKANQREYPMGIYCGSLYGSFRNIIGVEGSSYLYMDDETLYREIIGTVAELDYKCVEYTLQQVGGVFDYGHFWEDICFKNGPLVAPSVFDEVVGPHYRKFTDLLLKHGIDIVSLDCDGCIDALVPTWFNNGVNTMFPIEVGTWNASVAPWRERFGKGLRGVGGMNKVTFSRDRRAIDEEVQRLRRLVELGGYIPCPDHRIAPDAKWDLVRYYCDRMHAVFG